MNSTPSLQVDNLSVAYRGHRGNHDAVRDVSFSLLPGESLGLVGESGSGKSTLALSALALVKKPAVITGGRVWLQGEDFLKMPSRRQRAHLGRTIAFVPQDPLNSLDPIRSIGSQLRSAILAHNHRLDRKAVTKRSLELLEEVRIRDPEQRLRQHPHQLSGGQRQRILIACALAHDPAIVIADEPTTALDVTTQAQIFTLLTRLVERRNASMLLVTHNLALVAQFCDRLLLMQDGQIVESATTGAFFRAPTTPYGRELLAAVPRLPVVPLK